VRAFYGYNIDENIIADTATIGLGQTDSTTVRGYVTGGNQDSITLSIISTTQPTWTAVLGSTHLLDIPAGSYADTTLSVTVDPLATVGQTDVITVRATSDNAPGIFVDKTFTVTAGPYIAVVTVELSRTQYNIAHVTPVNTLTDPCYCYDPLTFDVKVTNKGLLDDKYELTVEMVPKIGQSGEPLDIPALKLTPDELFVPAGDTEYAALSVTLPDSWWSWDNATIVVTAVGMLSREYQQNLYPTHSASVTVIAGSEKSVQIEVLPDNLEPQTGAPGSPLVWLVVVKNTGNDPDEFVWTLSDIVSGRSSASAYRTSWDPWLEDSNGNPITPGVTPLSLNPCTKATAYLHVTVPSDAKTSEWDTITVDIESLWTNAYAEYTVKAHAVEQGPRIPEGQIEISVEAQIIAIEVWPNQWPVGVLDEDKIAYTVDDAFTVRNTGNVDEKISIKGTDAQSMPGEPVTTWTLDPTGTIGLDRYAMWVLPSNMVLTTTPQVLVPLLSPSDESTFGLKIQAPSAMTTPARMWARVKLTAVKA
jgi:hypothetical protein